MEVVSGRWRDLEQARMALAKFQRGSDTLNLALLRLATFARAIVQVDRVSIWDIDHLGRRLVRRAVSDTLADEILLLPLADSGAYAKDLVSRRVVAVDDVSKDEFTGVLLDCYCRPLKIVSMMDVPIYSGGDIVGVVCHERRGTAKAWSDAEADLALNVAELVSLLRSEQSAFEAEQSLRILEARYAELSRRTSLGRVARGIAHDLTSLLGVVETAAALLERLGNDPDTRTTVAEHLHDVSTSARGLVELLQQPSGSLELPPPVPFDETLRGLEGTLAALWGKADGLTLETAANSAMVRIVPAALTQILMNLVLNAKESDPNSDRLTIRSSREAPGPMTGAESVIVEVEDFGPGIDASVLEHLFDPHFSTKGPHRGQGLATVQRLVETAGGWIDVQSKPGRGSRFRVSLPLDL
jgi:two-component system, cell cycle sensor histidine kinase and response regulator CckA